MEYQKIINLLDHTKQEPSRFRTKNWVNHEERIKPVIKLNLKLQR